MNDRKLSLILLAVMCVSAMLVPVAVLVFVPERTLDKVLSLPWTVIGPVLVPVLTTSIAALWSFFTGPVNAKPVEVIRDPDVTPIDSVLRPPRLPDRKRSGSTGLDILLFVVALACLASLLHGCGASALRTHATANEIAGVVVETAEGLYAAHLEAASASCSDEPCVLAARASHASAEAAIGLVRVANKAYRAAIAVAAAAEDGAPLLPALLTMVLRIAALWGDMVAALAGLGVEAPALPFPLPTGGAQ